jgi:glutamyl-tRNA reductase
LEDCDETLVIDLANPRDIAKKVKEYDGVTLYDLDHLESVTEKTTQMRTESINDVENIIDEEVKNFHQQQQRQRADDVISSLHQDASQIKDEELDVATSKLDLDEEGQAVVESMADTMLSRLLAEPTDSIRDAAENDDWETIEATKQLFNV